MLCATVEYEREMWSRSKTKVLKSRSAAQYLHSDMALAAGNITRAAAAERALVLTKDGDRVGGGGGDVE